MKIYLKNCVNLLILINLCYITNNSTLIQAKEKEEAFKKMSSPEQLTLDPDKAWQTIDYNFLFKAASAVNYKKDICSWENYVFASSTNSEHKENPAWAIDLEDIYKLWQIRVVVAKKEAFVFKNAHAFAFVEKPNLEEIDFKKSCFFYKGPASNFETINFDCKSFGRYVAIALKGKNIKLQMCKLMVFVQRFDGNAKWTEWGYYTECKLSCGSEFRNRTRYCIASRTQKHCEGVRIEERYCPNNPCPIDGKWKNWISWTDCTKSCGSGQRSRTRKCTEPVYGGKQCEGKKKESEKCGTKDCPKELKKMTTGNKIIFPIIGSIGAVLLSAFVIAAVMYKRKIRRNSASSTGQSVLYQESGMD